MPVIKTFKPEQIYFEEVKVGEELPPVTKKYNLMKMAAFASVHGDWCPAHYDYKCVSNLVQYGIGDHNAPIAYGMQITGYCSQVLTNWIAPNGFLRKFTSRTTYPVYPFDTLTIHAKILKKYVEKDANCVECDIWAIKQDGITVAAKAWGLVILPSRKSS